MTRLAIVPFSDEHLDEAGGLLAARHVDHRGAEPLLPSRFEEPALAFEEVGSAWRRPGASGAAATRDGRLVGYLLGAPREDEIWGANVWVEAAGHAVVEAELVRDLYAAAAEAWFEEGRTRHYALVPATDTGLVEAWFRVGFGQQQAHAVREVPRSVAPVLPDGFEIREPREEDIDGLIAVDLALPAHQRSSPVFSERPLPSEDEIRSEWHKTLGADDETVLIGLHEGRPVACWAFASTRLSLHYHGLMEPDRAAYLGFASTLPQSRGSGIGVALTNALLGRAAEDGYAAMLTDWRVTNLLASRFWPRRGFRTAFVRLYRSIP
jgi:ribosomal protein S18 acetylase RimI-like enzyme